MTTSRGTALLLLAAATLLTSSAALADVAVPKPVTAEPAAAVPQAGAPSTVFAAAPSDLSRYKEAPIPGGNLLVAAYFVMWLVLAGFVARLLMRQSRLEAEIRSLEDRIEPGDTL
ncbi:MAG: CcmD family protein [Myxococcota bacterium]